MFFRVLGGCRGLGRFLHFSIGLHGSDVVGIVGIWLFACLWCQIMFRISLAMRDGGF